MYAHGMEAGKTSMKTAHACTNTHTCIILFHYSQSHFISHGIALYEHCVRTNTNYACPSRQPDINMIWWHDMVIYDKLKGLRSSLSTPPPTTVPAIFNLLLILSIFFSPPLYALLLLCGDWNWKSEVPLNWADWLHLVITTTALTSYVPNLRPLPPAIWFTDI